ncbi:SusC/RagA family TonB-linked outer membrane protein [Zunongwangia sp.]|uniref:SusC/RagA family TonB-linked outer membrane protein n=1 Tax=Zunongwangia sp. TaxID=1965325 RepID=UPI003AA84D55
MTKKLLSFLTFMLLFVVQMSFAQQRTVTGIVTDEEGLPLPGVNVIEKGTNNGVQTDFDGKYSIAVEQGSVLTFSYVGFATQQKTVNSTSINVTLSVDAAALDEVVVTGYGSRSKELSTSAVSNISSEEIENFVPSTSLDNVLQGKAAGVQVTSANGRPGQTAFVQIRGIGSVNAGTTPLYVVDGTPVDSDFVNNINPNDIESFSILKDAATASLYGSRGANGVVVITTKKGKSGDARIVIRSSIGSASKIDDINFDMMNASQKLELERQYAELGVSDASALPGAVASPEQLELLKSYNTNWQKELLRDSYVQSNSLSISGADDRLTYYLSLGYDKNTGIIDRIDGYERVSARLNTTYQAKKWLEVGANVSVSRNTTDLPRDRNNVQNPFVAMYSYNPYEPLYSRDDNGDIKRESDGSPIYNPTSQGFPIALALQTEPESIRNFLLLGSLYADFKFGEKFSNKFTVGGNSNRYNRTTRSISGGVLNSIVGDANFPGDQTDNYELDFQYNVNNIFNYTDTFGEYHNFSASFLLEYNERIYTDLFATSSGYPSPDIPYQDVAAKPTRVGSGEERNRLFSQGLFLDYNYDRKYILSGSIRRDGSSRFGPDNKYGYFYSGSAAWNIAEENFLKNSFVDDLKLRASYGTSGNQNIGEFNYLSLLEFDTYNGNTAARPQGIGNPDIQWESQALLDVGIEYSLFDNMISGVFDYYKKNSKDLLLERPISQTIGDEDNSILSNIGEIENSGFEISLNVNLIRNEKIRWSIGGNAAFLDNEVKALTNGNDIINGSVILREGEKINSFYLPRYAGVNPSNGQPLFLDKEGNITSEFSDSNSVLLKGKSPQADFEGGFYTSFKFHGFGLRSDFVFKKGNYILNYQKQDGLSISGITSNKYVDAFNYWKEPGDRNVYPNPIYQANADQTTTRFLESGDYLRLRNLTIDYTLPSKISSSIGLNSLRIFATGQNLLTFTNYTGDPEIGIGSEETAGPDDDGFVSGNYSLYSYPQLKTYTAGIEISF